MIMFSKSLSSITILCWDRSTIIHRDPKVGDPERLDLLIDRCLDQCGFLIIRYALGVKERRNNDQRFARLFGGKGRRE